jgi:hypothetical protein
VSVSRDLDRILAGDLAFLDEAMERGLIRTRIATELTEIDLERVRVARVLVRELEINWPGVEVILRMREEILTGQRRIERLIAELRRRRG